MVAQLSHAHTGQVVEREVKVKFSKRGEQESSRNVCRFEHPVAEDRSLQRLGRTGKYSLFREQCLLEFNT
jgi:hypothetical protein